MEIKQTEQKTWEGKVAMRKGMLALNRRAHISGDRIIIYKKDINDPELTINKQDIIDINTPQFDLFDAFIKGYAGFTVTYNSSSGQKTLSFWPNTIGAYQNNAELPQFANSIAVLDPKREAELKDTSKYQNKSWIVIFVGVASGLIGYYFFGLFGTIIIIVASLIAYWIYNSTSLDKSIRILLAVLIMGGGMGIAFILNVIFLILASSH